MRLICYRFVNYLNFIVSDWRSAILFLNQLKRLIVKTFRDEEKRIFKQQAQLHKEDRNLLEDELEKVNVIHIEDGP